MRDATEPESAGMCALRTASRPFLRKPLSLSTGLSDWFQTLGQGFYSTIVSRFKISCKSMNAFLTYSRSNWGYFFGPPCRYHRDDRSMYVSVKQLDCHAGCPSVWVRGKWQWRRASSRMGRANYTWRSSVLCEVSKYLVNRVHCSFELSSTFSHAERATQWNHPQTGKRKKLVGGKSDHHSVPSRVNSSSLCLWKFWNIQDNFDTDWQLGSIAPRRDRIQLPVGGEIILNVSKFHEHRDGTVHTLAMGHSIVRV